jgi:hypothetical protein
MLPSRRIRSGMGFLFSLRLARMLFRLWRFAAPFA